MKKLLFLLLLTFIVSGLWCAKRQSKRPVINHRSNSVRVDRNTRYAISYGEDTDWESITNVTFAGINNTTTGSDADEDGTPGYDNFAALVLPAQITAGVSYTLSVEINPDSDEHITAWIDWNQDNVFSTDTEQYILAEGVGTSGPFTADIEVPLSAVAGQTTMRVSLVYDDIPTPDLVFDYGEVEDYPVNVMAVQGAPGVPTSPTPANMAVDVALGATLSWTFGNDTQTYDLYFGAGSLPATPVVTNANVSVNTYNPGPLADATTYYWQLVPKNSTRIELQGPVWTFTTVITPVDTFPYVIGFEEGDFPTGWSQEYVTNARNWGFQTGDYDYASSDITTAHGGTYNAYFAGTNTSGDVTKLISRPVDLSSYGIATLSFWHAQQSWAGDQDYLTVYYRLNEGSSWVMLAEYTDDINEWTYRELNVYSTSSTMQFAFEGDARYGFGVVVDDITINGSDAPEDPTLMVNFTRYDFEPVAPAGQSEVATLTLTNMGNETLIISSSPVLSGSDAMEFSVDDQNTYPLQLAFSQTASIGLYSIPGSSGEKQATLSISHNGVNGMRAQQDITLTGVGVTTITAPEGAVVTSMPNHTNAANSDGYLGYMMFDNIDFTGVVTGIKFWAGLMYNDGNGWAPAYQDSIALVVAFARDNEGEPDMEAEPYSVQGINLHPLNTGVELFDGYLLYQCEFELQPVELDGPCWVAIYSADQNQDQCWFMVAGSDDGDGGSRQLDMQEQTLSTVDYDLAFCLTGFQALEVPQNITITVNETTTQVNWDHVAGANSYIVLRDTYCDGGFANTAVQANNFCTFETCGEIGFFKVIANTNAMQPARSVSLPKARRSNAFSNLSSIRSNIETHNWRAKQYYPPVKH